MLRVFTAEFQQEKKGIVRGFTEKKTATSWAKERLADEAVASIAIWQLSTAASPRDALAMAAEGRPWYQERVLLQVITRRGKAATGKAERK